MKSVYVAALGLACASPLVAQIAQIAPPSPAVVDLKNATAIAGDWSYLPTATGSDAVFRNATGSPQITMRCTRSTRRITFSKPAMGAAPFLVVWTSSISRSLPVSYQPTTSALVTDVVAFDSLLDAIAFSRGRIGFSVTGQPALIVPAWEEVARVIEDCRT